MNEVMECVRAKGKYKPVMKWGVLLPCGDKGSFAYRTLFLLIVGSNFWRWANVPCSEELAKKKVLNVKGVF